jgi:hypothetical protein
MGQGMAVRGGMRRGESTAFRNEVSAKGWAAEGKGAFVRVCYDGQAEGTDLAFEGNAKIIRNGVW